MKNKMIKLLSIAILAAMTLMVFIPVSVSAAEVPEETGLTETEIANLVFMREEEKLARDVYLTLYDTWELQVFESIARSESTHMNAILNILNSYGIADPADGNDIGEFTNPDLQSLYMQLVSQGSVSLAEALKVGGAIEEIDILDLQTAIAETDDPIIIQMYQSLLSGSENHLRAFARAYTQETGEDYSEQILPKENVSAILAGSQGRYGSTAAKGNRSGRSGDADNTGANAGQSGGRGARGNSRGGK